MKGHCLCKAVTVTAPDKKDMSACHCSTCRRWGGGPLLCVHVGPDAKFEGSDNITAYRSSDWAERGFCKVCGSHLFYRLVQAGEYILPVGLFQQGPAFTFQEQIFVDEKPADYEFANDTPKLTGAEVFAKFTPPG